MLIDKVPTLSVIMSAYNSGLYIEEAIQSIINQTFTDFEFLILDDGSIDNSLEVIKKMSIKDHRIKYFSRENKGVVSSLNELISMAKGRFIARMDSDDVVSPTRFEEQLEYMAQNDIDICGTSIVFFGKKKEIFQSLPVSRKNIYFDFCMQMCSICQASIIIKSEILRETPYSTKYPYAEDYELFTKLVMSGHELYNIDRYLYRYRVHSEQISSAKSIEQLTDISKSSREFRLWYINKLGYDDLKEDLDIYFPLEQSLEKTKRFITSLLIFSERENIDTHTVVKYICSLVSVYGVRNFSHFFTIYFGLRKFASVGFFNTSKLIVSLVFGRKGYSLIKNISWNS